MFVNIDDVKEDLCSAGGAVAPGVQGVGWGRTGDTRGDGAMARHMTSIERMAARAADRLATRSAELLVSIGEADVLACQMPRGDGRESVYAERDGLIAVREAVDGLCERIVARWL
jgi:hypothetical protein